jgi:tetratricopeptide (TPR) repeat protein
MIMKRFALFALLCLSIIGFALPFAVSAQDATETPAPTTETTVQPTATPEPLPDCPAFPDEAEDVRTGYYMGEGLAYLQSGQTNSAIFSFTCVIRVIDTSYVPAYMTRASAYAFQRDFDRAIRDYSHAIELDGNLTAAYNNRGIVYVSMGEYDEAASDFDRVIALEADNIAGYNNRSVIYALDGDYDAAIALLEENIARSGIDDVLTAYEDPDRPAEAEPIEFDRAASQSYALLGMMYSAKSLDAFNDYLLVNRGSGYFVDDRVQAAASAIESRFTFEMRLDDGSWLYVADFTPTR